MSTRELGKWGEELATEYLLEHGYTLVQRNFSCRYGEIDIIAERDAFIVFLEVKLRRNDSFAEAREFVTFSKQKRIISSATMWLSTHDTDKQPRFDVLEIYAERGMATKQPRLIYYEDAFQ